MTEKEYEEWFKQWSKQPSVKDVDPDRDSGNGFTHRVVQEMLKQHEHDLGAVEWMKKNYSKN